MLYLSKYKKLLYLAVPPIGRFINLSDQLALSLLLATAVGFLADHMWRKGGLIHFGAADIFTLISILQLKANKHKEQICTLEVEFQTLSKAHTDMVQICT